jgi:uncharacterized protein
MAADGRGTARPGDRAAAPFPIGGEAVPPGSRRTVDLPLSVLSNHTPVTLPVRVVHGRLPGPALFVSAAVHGDEVQGVEIIRRLLKVRGLSGISGTLLAIPIVNAFGFISHSRYMPDRRDLNRSFPGSELGSLAAQLADLFMREVVRKADLGIDLHTAATHRTNLPQIRISGASDRLRALARAFGAPVVIETGFRDGSLRKAAAAEGVEMLLYEAGEALRFDEAAIRLGVRGILSVMEAAGMTPPPRAPAPLSHDPAWSRAIRWLRSPKGGILRTFRQAGDAVEAGEVLAVVSDPFGARELPVTAAEAGLIIGRTNLPVVNLGDALFHLARLSHGAPAAVGQAERAPQADPLFDEDEII